MSELYGLSNDQLRAAAPSIFATHPITTASERYAFVPTINIINGLRERGLVPVSARQSRNRIADRAQFAQHVVRMRVPNTKVQVGDVFPEAVITNSHDTGSRYHVYAGLFRLWCANGATTPMGK
ncbi:MAG TPA: DUF932 domain-containing protein, partial [Nitrospira sp.]|nr:DUF932 domain-containing protein [Nitrospira sp.]